MKATFIVCLGCLVCLVLASQADPKSESTPARGCDTADMFAEGQVPPDGPGTYVLKHAWFAGQSTPGWHQGSKLLSAVRVTKNTWWIKVGLEIEAGHVVTLRVPATYQRAYSLGWGAAGERSQRLTPCRADSTGRWTFFAGGFGYHKPICAPLQVMVDGRTATIRFGLGTGCGR